MSDDEKEEEKGYQLTREQCEAAFRKIDVDCSGTLDVDEVTRAMNHLGMDKRREEVEQIMGDAGASDGRMNVNQFTEMMQRKEARLGVEKSGLAAILDNLWVKRGRMLFSFVLAIYTLVTLWGQFREASRKELALQFDPPSSRCIPFFDTVKDWHSNHKNSSEVLYDYRNGEALIRVCTDEPQAEVVEAIGKDKEYYPFAELDCDLRDSYKESLVIDNCLPKPQCNARLNENPTPFGVNWRNSLTLKKNESGSSSRNGTSSGSSKRSYPPCTIEIDPVDGIPPCTRSYVGSFHEQNKNLSTFLLLVALVPLIVMIVQFGVLINFTCKDFPTELEQTAAWALQGIPGPIFYLVYYMKRSNTIQLDELQTTTLQWALLSIEDAVEGLVAPLVAIWGCNLGRFPVSLGLLILKVLKFAWGTLSYWRGRKAMAYGSLAKMSENLLDPTNANNDRPIGHMGSPGMQPQPMQPMPGTMPPPQQQGGWGQQPPQPGYQQPPPQPGYQQPGMQPPPQNGGMMMQGGMPPPPGQPGYYPQQQQQQPPMMQQQPGHYPAQMPPGQELL